MDFDLEIISEEGDRPDPLFDSIMNAMNSMKEATADKIYQKIQKEGATNYSKPQVDRALASALKYGIFEVKNNRYRVRDDALDDEDTVYWKLQRKRDQTPFRIQEDVNEKHTGPKLDPERDNQRFRKPTEANSECPHCGRAKRPRTYTAKAGRKPNSKSNKKKRKIKKRTVQREPSNVSTRRRKRRDPSQDEEKSAKRRKSNIMKASKPSEVQIRCSEDKLLQDLQKDMMDSPEATSESSDSDMEELNDTENKYTGYNENKSSHNRNMAPTSAFSSECIKTDLDIIQLKRSSISVRTDSGSERDTCMSSASEEPSQTRTTDGFFEERPCTSKNTTAKVRNQYLHSGEMYSNQYERGQTDNKNANSDWLGCSDEPQGAVIQSNNVLTIEPMDSLSFKNPEQASYIS